MDIEGKSGINTLRIVLNEIFMTNYEMLDNPESICININKRYIT